jgi:iron uptake system component EfeO
MAFAAAGVAVALALAGAAVAAVAAGGSTTKTTIKVTEREYHIAISTSSARAGTVTFSVHNAGKVAHELDLAGGGLKSTAHLATIAPGKTRTVTLRLTGGTLSLWCPVPGHAALGMKTSLKVTGGATATSGNPPPTQTDEAWG